MAAPRPVAWASAALLLLGAAPAQAEEADLTLRLTLRVDNASALYPGERDRPLAHTEVELWDRELVGPDRLVAADRFTDAAGFVEIRVPNDDGLLEGGLDPYVVVHARAQPEVAKQPLGNLNVTDPRLPKRLHDVHTFFVAFPDDQPPGVLAPPPIEPPAAKAAPFYILAQLVRGHVAMADAGFRPGPTDVRWGEGHVAPCGAREPSCYDPATGLVHVDGTPANRDQWDADVVLHAYGHRVLHLLYEGAWPARSSVRHEPATCMPHGAAWVEGFATWFQGFAQRDVRFEDGLGDGTWRLRRDVDGLDPGNEGDCYEFSVAGLLWDLVDTNSDGADRVANMQRDIVDAARWCRPMSPMAFHACWHSTGRPNHTALHALLDEHHQLRALYGADVHSRWLDPDLEMDHARTRGRVNATGLEIAPTGSPGAADMRAWLDGLGGLQTMVAIRTDQAHPMDRDVTDEQLEEVFRRYTFLQRGYDQVVLVLGANEPLTKGKGVSREKAVARVQQEFRMWNGIPELRDIPLCHKFTHPERNNGTTWADIEALWRDHQDLVCYDFYPATNAQGVPFDTDEDLERLRANGAALGKGVHIVETKVPGDRAARLEDIGRRIFTGHGDSVSVFHLLDVPPGKVALDDAGWWWENGGWTERSPATMLKSLLCPCPSA